MQLSIGTGDGDEMFAPEWQLNFLLQNWSMLSPPPVTMQSCLSTFVQSPVLVRSSISLYVLFHVSDALFCSRCIWKDAQRL
jgi:hypothetical protein